MARGLKTVGQRRKARSSKVQRKVANKRSAAARAKNAARRKAANSANIRNAAKRLATGVHGHRNRKHVNSFNRFRKQFRTARSPEAKRAAAAAYHRAT